MTTLTKTGTIDTRFYAVALIVLSLLPSVFLTWSYRDLPHLGAYHDDTIYLTTARSLADGRGYRLIHLPDAPAQTKYPPLYPLLLSAAWRSQKTLPAVLPLAALLTWIWLPCTSLLSGIWARTCGFSRRHSVIIAALLAINPVLAMFGFTLMSELLFTSLLLGSLVLLECSGRVNRPLLFVTIAALLAGLAFLTRTSGIALLLTAPGVLWWQRRRREAALFAALLLIPAVAWQLWVHAHAAPQNDALTAYYTSYIKMQMREVRWADLPEMMYQNLDAVLTAIGRCLLFSLSTSPGFKMLAWALAVGAMAGAWQVARRSGCWHFVAFGVVSLGMLLVWHYPADQRFVLPLVPLLLVGMWEQIAGFTRLMAATWQRRKSGDRPTAVFCAGLLAILLLGYASQTVDAYRSVLPEFLESQRAGAAQSEPAYRWLQTHTPANAHILAYNDPLVYLRTGRHACSFPILPSLVYHPDEARAAHYVEDAGWLLDRCQLTFVLATPDDFFRDLHEHAAGPWHATLQREPYQLRHAANGYSVYEIQQRPLASR